MIESVSPPEELKIPAFMRRRQLLRKQTKKTPLERHIEKVHKKAAESREITVTAKREVKTRVIKTIPRYVAPQKPQRKSEEKPIGIITHYYDKIQVAVMKCSGTLKLGDIIRIMGQNGAFEQTIESMQHNKKAIKRAGIGKDIGLKVLAQPILGEIVYKV